MQLCRGVIVLPVSDWAALLHCYARSCRGLPPAQGDLLDPLIKQITNWGVLKSGCVIWVQGALRGELTKSS